LKSTIAKEVYGDNGKSIVAMCVTGVAVGSLGMPSKYIIAMESKWLLWKVTS
jgi:hypothetical protein